VLRQAVATYLSTSRGVKCVPEQVAIVSGVQEALDLVARLFLNPGDRVCVENPGYPGAATVFKAVGAKISAIGVDDEGMQLREASLEGVQLVYVTPGHQFPLGVTMSLPRRLQKWAGNSGALILEDDYDSEYRDAGRPLGRCRDSTATGWCCSREASARFSSRPLGWDIWWFRPTWWTTCPRLSRSQAATRRCLNRRWSAISSPRDTSGEISGACERCMRSDSRFSWNAHARISLDCSRFQAWRLGYRLRVGCAVASTVIVAAAAKRGVEVTPLSRYSHRRGGARRTATRIWPR
jgi:hypothetical protein